MELLERTVRGSAALAWEERQAEGRYTLSLPEFATLGKDKK